MIKLRAAQERDEAQAVAWRKDTSDEDKMRVWNLIQALGGAPMLEAISRFAQLGMTHAALLAEEGEPPCPATG